VCHCPKCEFITQLNFPFKAIFYNLIEFLLTKITQNSIFFTPFFFSNFFSLNPIYWKFSTISRAHLNFLIILNLYLNEFSMKKLLNIQWLFHYGLKHYEINSVHTYTTRAFQEYQEHNKRCYGLGDLNIVTNKTNKLPSFIRRYIVPCANNKST